MHLARLAWTADSNCRLLLVASIAVVAISRLGQSRTTTQDLLLTRPEPMDSLTDLLPCDPKQVAPLLLAWHQSPPELPDLDRAKHVSIQLQALNWSSEFCDERSEYEPSSIPRDVSGIGEEHHAQTAPWKAVCGTRAGACPCPTGAVLLRVQSRRVGVQGNA